MRSENGKHFENVIGLIDRNPRTGEEFKANFFDCNKPLVAGNRVMVGDKEYQYHGEDSLGRSVFTLDGRPAIEAVLGCR